MPLGVGIYIFFILANSKSGTNSSQNAIALTECSFTLDGGVPVRYRHPPDTSSTILYEQPVFSQTNIPNGKHKLNITVDARTAVYINFDYAIYTYASALYEVCISLITTPCFYRYDDVLNAASSSASASLSESSKKPTATGDANQDGAESEPKSEKSSTNVGAIVGGVVGGVVVILLIVLFFFYKRRKVNRQALDATSPPPPDLVAQPYPSTLYAPLNTLHGAQSSSFRPNRLSEFNQAPASAPITSRGYPYAPTTEGSVYTAPYGGIATTSTASDSHEPTQRHLGVHNPSSSIDSSPPVSPQPYGAFSEKRRIEEHRAAGGGEVSLAEMREQMQAMKQEIQVLKGSGVPVPDDQPPMYSPGGR